MNPTDPDLYSDPDPPHWFSFFRKLLYRLTNFRLVLYTILFSRTGITGCTERGQRPERPRQPSIRGRRTGGRRPRRDGRPPLPGPCQKRTWRLHGGQSRSSALTGGVKANRTERQKIVFCLHNLKGCSHSDVHSVHTHCCTNNSPHHKNYTKSLYMSGLCPLPPSKPCGRQRPRGNSQKLVLFYERRRVKFSSTI